VLGKGEQLLVESCELTAGNRRAQHRIVGLFDHLLVGEIVKLRREFSLTRLCASAMRAYIALACSSTCSGLIKPSATS